MSEAIPSNVLLVSSEAKPSFSVVYRDNAAFVWRSLRRLGVRPADVEDVCQDVFVVVHAKLGDFYGGSIRAWLFAIAVRVAADYRKRAFMKRETSEADHSEPATLPEQADALEKKEAVAMLEAILASLDDEKRSVFILFELEQMPMTEVARALDCPVQTAYSRLHAAREHVTSAVARWQKRSLAQAPGRRP